MGAAESIRPSLTKAEPQKCHSSPRNCILLGSVLFLLFCILVTAAATGSQSGCSGDHAQFTNNLREKGWSSLVRVSKTIGTTPVKDIWLFGLFERLSAADADGRGSWARLPAERIHRQVSTCGNDCSAIVCVCDFGGLFLHRSF